MPTATNEFLVFIFVLNLCGSESRFPHPHRVLVSTGILLNSLTYSSSSTHFLWFLHLSSLNDPFTHLCPNVSSVLCFRVPKQHQHNINSRLGLFSSTHYIIIIIALNLSLYPTNWAAHPAPAAINTTTWLHNFRHPYKKPLQTDLNLTSFVVCPLLPCSAHRYHTLWMGGWTDWWYDNKSEPPPEQPCPNIDLNAMRKLQGVIWFVFIKRHT